MRNWFWIWPLFIYFGGLFIGGAIWNRIAYRRGYRRGVQDGMAKRLYAWCEEYKEEPDNKKG